MKKGRKRKICMLKKLKIFRELVNTHLDMTVQKSTTYRQKKYFNGRMFAKERWLWQCKQYWWDILCWNVFFNVRFLLYSIAHWTYEWGPPESVLGPLNFLPRLFFQFNQIFAYFYFYFRQLLENPWKALVWMKSIFKQKGSFFIAYKKYTQHGNMFQLHNSWLLLDGYDFIVLTWV